MSDHVTFLLAANSSLLFSQSFFPSDTPPTSWTAPCTYSQNSTTALVMLVVLMML